ncbi:MAG: histidine phosphatase family protein [Gemmatimonadales bacterium]|nr:MAG: histidine phosphatase family protein [Gemmatimonadales bacterium]
MTGSRTIHLLRHAKSSWDDPGLADLRRPLAARGRRAAKAVRAHLEEEGIVPDVILCSPATRTRQTLDGISGAVDGVPVQIEEGIYFGGELAVLGLLRSLPRSCRSVMVIGHNPTLEELAVDLLDPDQDHHPSVDRMRGKYPTAALATFETSDQWSHLEPGGCRLVSFVRPKDLPGY